MFRLTEDATSALKLYAVVYCALTDNCLGFFNASKLGEVFKTYTHSVCVLHNCANRQIEALARLE